MPDPCLLTHAGFVEVAYPLPEAAYPFAVVDRGMYAVVPEAAYNCHPPCFLTLRFVSAATPSPSSQIPDPC